MKSQQAILGIHHVTAIAGDAQKNLDFYSGILGMRMVKKTVNFDDPLTYHLYYGDEVGHPGTLLTFFPWSSQAHRGRKGAGQFTVFSFSIPHDAVAFWMERLKQMNIQTEKPFTRFDEEVISGIDYDGFQFELIAASNDTRTGWGTKQIPESKAIRGFHGVTMLQNAVEPTEEMLVTSLEFKRKGESGNRIRFETGEGGSGTCIDIIVDSKAETGFMGAGIIHHVAWRTPTDESQLNVRETLIRNGVRTTPVIDRNYFHSIYFSDPPGAIFEVATDPPGFMVDESKEELGTSLKLPPQYEAMRSQLEKTLPQLVL